MRDLNNMYEDIGSNFITTNVLKKVLSIYFSLNILAYNYI